MYKSPIDVIYQDINMQFENAVVRAVQKCDINVDKDELVRALRYDREQYEKGYADGRAYARWIPCEERLPEPDEEVLVYLWGDVPYLARVNGEGQWETDHFYLDADDAPKAWMPLPEPARWDGA